MLGQNLIEIFALDRFLITIRKLITYIQNPKFQEKSIKAEEKAQAAEKRVEKNFKNVFLWLFGDKPGCTAEIGKC